MAISERKKRSLMNKKAWAERAGRPAVKPAMVKDVLKRVNPDSLKNVERKLQELLRRHMEVVCKQCRIRAERKQAKACASCIEGIQEDIDKECAQCRGDDDDDDDEPDLDDDQDDDDDDDDD